MAGLNLQGVALPPYAREDLAWSDVIVQKGALGQTPVKITAPGEYLLYPTTLVVTVVTDATVINRLLLYDVLTPDGVVAEQLPSPVLQPASIGYFYSINLGLSSAYATGNAIAMPLPSYLIETGWQIAVFVSSLQPGDQITINASVIKIPTGPPAGGGSEIPGARGPVAIA